MPKRTLYECFNAKVKGDRIYCAKGRSLSWHSADGALDIKAMARGEPLVFAVCQGCPNFASIGEPLDKSEKGWVDRIFIQKEVRPHSAQMES